MNPCPGCRNEPEPGYIEMPNNGPIVPCWLCNREQWLLDNDHTLRDVFPTKEPRLVALT